jgi:hypothetical protein
VSEIKHASADRKDDLYETPDVAVHALMRVEKLPHRVWEPACGRGAIVRVLRAAGHTVVATDLVDYSSPDQDEHGVDFTMEHKAWPVRLQLSIQSNRSVGLRGRLPRLG